MAVWSVINRTDLVDSGRNDAEYFKPEYIQIDRILSKIDALPLKYDLQFVKCGPFGSTIRCDSYLNNGVVVARPFNINGMILEYNNLAFISYEDAKRKNLFLYEDSDIFFSRVGDIRVGLLCNNTEYTDITISPNIIAARLKENFIKAEYAVIFLNTKYGLKQIERGLKVVAQPTISTSIIRKLFIYNPGEEIQHQLSKLFRLALEKYNQSKSLYTQIRQILESELGLDKLSFHKPVGYTAQFSELEKSRRFDPEHYHPTFKNLLNHLPPGVKLSPLSAHLSFCQRGKQPNYAKQGLPVINSRHVQPNRVIFEGNRRAAANPISDLQIRFGDVLLNGTGRGTIGRAAPYLQNTEAVPDNHVTILRSPDLDPVLISLYLNSIAGQLQVEMHQRGTSGQIELYPFDIRRFLIWDAPEGLQKELRSLYDQAAAAERTSKELLEEAKTRVEQLIEEAVKS